jgi:hypothetical protein
VKSFVLTAIGYFTGKKDMGRDGADDFRQPLHNLVEERHTSVRRWVSSFLRPPECQTAFLVFPFGAFVSSLPVNGEGIHERIFYDTKYTDNSGLR